jgi:hypothetical protein
MPSVRQRSEAVDVDCGQLVWRRLKDVAVVMDLHELAPVGGWAADGRHRQHQRQHPCRPSSAPMPTHISVSAEPVLFFTISFSSFFYTYMGYPSRHIQQPNGSLPPYLAVGVHPGFSPPDSGDPFQTAPRSPRWLIGLPRPSKPSPAKAFSRPEPPAVCAAGPSTEPTSKEIPRTQCPPQPPPNP